MNLFTYATESTWRKLSPLWMAGQLPQQGTPWDKSLDTDTWHTLAYAFVEVFSFWSTSDLLEKKKKAQKTFLWNHWVFFHYFQKRTLHFQKRKLISLTQWSVGSFDFIYWNENKACFLIVFAVLKCKYADYMFTKNICLQEMASTAQS